MRRLGAHSNDGTKKIFFINREPSARVESEGGHGTIILFYEGEMAVGAIFSFFVDVVFV
jgi:hypothetical protein